MALSRSRVIGFPTEALVLAATLSGTAASHAAVTISTAATSNMSCASGVCTPTARNAVLNVSQLESMLSSSSVTVNTAGALASVIDVKAALTWTSANGLTLDAYQSITVEKPVADNGTASLTLLTDDGGTGGVLSFTSKGSISFLGTSNTLTINGNAYTLVSNITMLASDIANNPSGFYALAGNYNAAADGTYDQSPIMTTFEGTFEGLGNTISNLSIASKDVSVGLFTQINAPAAIRDVRLASVNVTAFAAGALVGSLLGAAYGDSATGTITGNLKGGAVGGLIGGAWASSSIVDCTSSAKVSALKPHSIAGGLVGALNGALSNSSAIGTVSVGEGSPKGDDSGAAGGLVGVSSGVITGSYATGRVKGERESSVGGLVGFTARFADPAYITNSYATGAVSGGQNSRVGGLVALDDIQPSDVAISDAYSIGALSGGTGDTVGGLIGDDDNSGGCGCLADTYWDTTTSGITNLGQGAGNIANDPGITGETSAQLQAGLPAGFDPTIWAENPSVNNGLPYLIANPPQ
jgi:hypothetical protein